MARQSILGVAGDLLPNYRVIEVQRDGRTRKKIKREMSNHKDGETPGQEWTRREILAIRTLANPATASPKNAAKVCKCTVRLIEKFLRNPYFQNEIYKLTNSNLMNARAAVIDATIRAATGGSSQDRTLYFRLVGDLKNEQKVKMEQHQHHTFGDMEDAELDDWIKDDINKDGGDIDRLIDDSNPDA